MIIGLFPNEEIKSSFDVAKKIADYLTKNNIKVVAEDEKAKTLNIPSLSSVNVKKLKFLISLGGDGTILRLAHKYSDLDAAILGINLGNLGFMADIPSADIFESLDDLISKKYKVEKRIIIEAISSKGEVSFAANDVTFHRAHNHSLIDISISVDNKYLNTFSADGIIIATPNGSTAYSLSAGGPILYPTLDAFLITPICPHAITNRPIIIPADTEIEIKYLSKFKSPIEVHSDGLVHFEMRTNETFKIKKSKKEFKLVKLERHNYFSTLRSKLNWAGKIGVLN
ncbi:MAG: NAD kinase [Candidatus Anoxychlamydiales bacterium]|nr:NAD kinase [Candidatus Anoxychlamydiales bacterium]